MPSGRLYVVANGGGIIGQYLGGAVVRSLSTTGQILATRAIDAATLGFDITPPAGFVVSGITQLNSGDILLDVWRTTDVSDFFNNLFVQRGWLRMTANLTNPVYEEFAGIPTNWTPSFLDLFLGSHINTDGRLGYVDYSDGIILTGDIGDSFVYGYLPTGGAPQNALAINNLLGVWCFAQDNHHTWALNIDQDTETVQLVYGSAGTTPPFDAVVTTAISEAASIPITLSVDHSSGLLYALTLPVGGPTDGTASIYQIDRDRGVINTYTLTQFSELSILGLGMTASNGYVYSSTVIQLPGSPSTLLGDGIFKINAATGAGTDVVAFRAFPDFDANPSQPYFVTSIYASGGVAPALRQRQRDDGLAYGNGPRTTAGPNHPTSQQYSLRRGPNNTYW